MTVLRSKYTKKSVFLFPAWLALLFLNTPQMKKIYLFLLILFTIISCSKEIDIPLPKGRTILVYLAGDNNLSPEVKEMHTAFMEGWNPKTNGSLVIFADRKNSSPVLIKIEQRNNIIIADTLRRYTMDNAASPELLKQVIADTRELVPGESYGMILFSHATGWLPAKAFLNPAEWGAGFDDSPKIVPRSIFDDRGIEMELADFAAAIPDGMFEFMAFDMCFMSSVETAYSLRNKTQYIVAAAPEILSPGFTPIYATSLDLLYKQQADLEGFAQAFYDYFNGLQGQYQSAAISVVKTDGMESLAVLTREIKPQLNQEQIDKVQYYDRQGKPHVFFDYGDYLRQVATPTQANRLDDLLSKTVIFKRNTPKLININIVKHSGLSVYIPQDALPRLNKAHEGTEWGKAVKN